MRLRYWIVARELSLFFATMFASLVFSLAVAIYLLADGATRDHADSVAFWVRMSLNLVASLWLMSRARKIEWTTPRGAQS